MKIVADESVDYPIVLRLREDNFDVFSIADELRSIVDIDVLKVARERTSLLLTGDKDFGALAFQFWLSHCGIVLLRLEGMNADEKAELVGSIFVKRSMEFVGAFSVITRMHVRIRRPASEH